MLFTDHKVCLKQNKELVEKEIKKIKEIQGITILSVGIGSHIDIRELKEINSDERKVMRFGEYTNREIVGKSISHGMLLFGLIQLGGQRRQGVSLKSINATSWKSSNPNYSVSSSPVFLLEG